MGGAPKEGQSKEKMGIVGEPPRERLEKKMKDWGPGRKLLSYERWVESHWLSINILGETFFKWEIPERGIRKKLRGGREGH